MSGWFIWVIFPIIIISVYWIWATNKLNRDPMQHHLLQLLYLAANQTDNVYDSCEEMQTLINEIKKMNTLDGNNKTKKRLLHLGSMIQHYGEQSPMVKARASLIIDRIIQNTIDLIHAPSNTTQITQVYIPTIEEIFTELSVATWFKKVGDTVKLDELLCEVETDKFTYEVLSKTTGKLKRILVEEGTEFEAHDPLAEIE